MATFVKLIEIKRDWSCLPLSPQQTITSATSRGIQMLSHGVNWLTSSKQQQQQHQSYSPGSSPQIIHQQQHHHHQQQQNHDHNLFHARNNNNGSGSGGGGATVGPVSAGDVGSNQQQQQSQQQENTKAGLVTILDLAVIHASVKVLVTFCFVVLCIMIYVMKIFADT